MRKYLCIFFILGLVSCSNKEQDKPTTLGKLAEEYVKLGLAIGQYDDDFVDAYYGPDSLKPVSAKLPVFPKDSFLLAANNLKRSLGQFITKDTNDSQYGRAAWITAQLTAFERRIRIFSGEYGSFDEESKDLFGVVAPRFTENHFKTLVAELDSVLPGRGDIPGRFQALANRFIIPKDKIDTVFRTAISVSRKRTMEHFGLPADENFKLEYVSGKSWSGYNWYKGGYSSLIQLNTDSDIFIERAIDVASHESYPGHHVYNMLLEKNLYKEKGWVEISLYPLFSPQSLIAEGSANYGIELVFPGEDKTGFAKTSLLPLAGIDTTGISFYFKVLELKGKLNFVRNEVARGLLNNSMSEETAISWLQEYGLNNEATAKKSVSFIRKYRSYVINYNYGLQLIRTYIENGLENDYPGRWKRFGELLSAEMLIPTLLR
jgi:hypothetical protein